MRRLLVSLCLVLAWGCESPRETSGTNTNWLRACDEDAECGAPAGCVCGRCTLACTADAECPAGTLCAPATATPLQCRGRRDEPRTCQAGCAGSGDCPSGQFCQQGVCTDQLPVMQCPAEALVCEDFEGEPPDFAAVVTAGNSLDPVATETPSGDFALEAVVADGPSVAHWDARIEPQSSGTLFVRGWVRLPAEDAYDLAPLGLWSAEETDWALRLVVKDARLEVWSYTTPLTSSVALLPGAWHCLEARVVVAEAPEGRVEVSLDGEPVATAAEIDALPEGGIDSLILGTVWAGAPATILVDRVLLSTSPTSCWD